MDLERMIKDSTLTRGLAIVFAFLVMVASLAIAMLELIQGQPLNIYIVGILGTGLGYVLNILGVNQGVMLQNVKPPTTPTQPTKTTPLP